MRSYEFFKKRNQECFPSPGFGHGREWLTNFSEKVDSYSSVWWQTLSATSQILIFHIVFTNRSLILFGIVMLSDNYLVFQPLSEWLYQTVLANDMSVEVCLEFGEAFCFPEKNGHDWCCPSLFLPALNINRTPGVTAAILCPWANMREGRETCDILALTSQVNNISQQSATSRLFF